VAVGVAVKVAVLPTGVVGGMLPVEVAVAVAVGVLVTGGVVGGMLPVEVGVAVEVLVADVAVPTLIVPGVQEAGIDVPF